MSKSRPFGFWLLIFLHSRYNGCLIEVYIVRTWHLCVPFTAPAGIWEPPKDPASCFIRWVSLGDMWYMIYDIYIYTTPPYQYQRIIHANSKLDTKKASNSAIMQRRAPQEGKRKKKGSHHHISYLYSILLLLWSIFLLENFFVMFPPSQNLLRLIARWLFLQGISLGQQSFHLLGDSIHRYK